MPHIGVIFHRGWTDRLLFSSKPLMFVHKLHDFLLDGGTWKENTFRGAPALASRQPYYLRHHGMPACDCNGIFIVFLTVCTLCFYYS